MITINEKCTHTITEKCFDAAASATDSAIQKKIYGSGMTILITSNDEMEDIMEIVIIFEESSLLNEGVTRKMERR